MRQPRSLAPLAVVTGLDFAAQIPYYIHNDYTPAHPLPGVRALLLLGGALVWFAAGLVGYRAQRRCGRAVLMSFLAVEALFYVKTFATGAAFFQLQNRSDLVRAIFVVGYVSGLTAAVYFVALWRQPPPRAPRHDVCVGEGVGEGEERGCDDESTAPRRWAIAPV